MNIPEGFKLVPVDRELIEAIAYFDKGNRTVGEIQTWAKDVLMRHDNPISSPTPPKPIYSALNFVCTALPGPGKECAFVELENEAGESLGRGEWRNREDGLVELHIAAPQPIYDEAKERELFEDWYKGYTKQGWSVSKAGTRAAWLACAQSRAKSPSMSDEWFDLGDRS